MHAWDIYGSSQRRNFLLLFVYFFVSLRNYLDSLCNNLDTAGCRQDADGTACQEKDQSRPQDVWSWGQTCFDLEILKSWNIETVKYRNLETVNTPRRFCFRVLLWARWVSIPASLQSIITIYGARVPLSPWHQLLPYMDSIPKIEQPACPLPPSLSLTSNLACPETGLERRPPGDLHRRAHCYSLYCSHC
jgi:hypothetical protein